MKKGKKAKEARNPVIETPLPNRGTQEKAK
jgi:hypothetical protein